jgi:uncharacterized membrane protein
MQVATKSNLEGYTWLVYGLQMASIFIPFIDVIGLIINIAKKDEAELDPVIAAHFRWQMKTFIWYCAWALIAGALCLTVVGIVVAVPIFIATYIWSMYRPIRGMLALMNRQTPKSGY